MSENSTTVDVRLDGRTIAEEIMKYASPRLEVLSEPLTYSAHVIRDRSGFRVIEDGSEPRSYVRDLIASEHRSDGDARARLERHAREMRVLGEHRQRNLHPTATGEMEARVMNWTAGTGGYFAPPLWLVEWFATAPRPGRVLADLVPNFDLPVGWASVNLPRLTTGTQTGLQGALGGTVPEQDVADSQVNATVQTIAGNLSVPVQLIEQSPVGAHFDWVVFTDMEADYNLQLERLLISTLMTGLVTTPYAATIAYTDATPTASEIYTSLGQLMAVVAKNRGLPHEFWMMRTARAAWLGSSEDQQQRPLMLSNTAGTGQWDLLSIAVKMNDAILTTYGSGGNEDRILAVRPADWVLLESDMHTDVMFDTPLSGNLAARCQLRRYVAPLCRYPSGQAALTGTGMIPPTGF